MTGMQKPWDQYALLAEFASRMDGQRLGRTALQKFTYLLQELHGVDAGYDFPLYTYGPFSSELLGDLDTLAALQGVSVAADVRQGGYLISPGPRIDSIRNMGAAFLRTHEASITAVLDAFGGMSAKDLELRSTVVFAQRDALRKGKAPDEESLVETVREIKPHFSIDQVRAAITELSERGYL